MLDKPNSNRPEEAPKNYNIDNSVLSEVRFAESSSIKEEMSYIYWSGKTSKDRNESGVAFLVWCGLLPNMSEYTKLVSDTYVEVSINQQ